MGLHYAGVPKLEHETNRLEQVLIAEDAPAIDEAYCGFLNEITMLMNVYGEAHDTTT